MNLKGAIDGVFMLSLINERNKINLIELVDKNGVNYEVSQ